MEWELTLFAMAYLVLGLDSLWVDWILWRCRLGAQELTQEENNLWDERPEKKILILVPAWKESGIIQGMLRGNLDRIKYQNYRFLVGSYPNDMATYRSILEVSKSSSKICTFINDQPGPTSKGQLLNRMVQEVVRGAYGEFDILLFQDAEDIIHPLSLKLVNHSALNYGFVQIPVFSFPIEKRLNSGAVYMEEFAESHTRDLLVRSHVKAALPSAGVGTALTKRAVQKILAAQKGELFDDSCLTEDYCLGLKAFELGIKQTFACRYQTRDDGSKDWIATREYFPKTLKTSMKQKARWIQGITLESFQRVGWFGSISNQLFLWRDRKALIANSLGLVGLLGVPFLMGLESIPRILQWLLPLNGVLFLVRFILRYQAFYSVYERRDWVSLLMRYPLSILVNGAAGFLAIKNFAISQIQKKPSVWVKTEHEIPVGFGLVKEGQLLLLAFLIMTCGVSQSFGSSSPPCIQIFYDKAPEGEEENYFGRIHALFIQNLMGHFPRWQQKVAPITTYQKGQLEECKANIYLGTHFRTQVPKEFFGDFVKTRQNVLWAGYHIWELESEELEKLWGVTFRGMSSLDWDHLDSKKRPGFFKTLTYKGEIFEKYGEFDRKNPQKFNAAFEQILLERTQNRPNDSQVLSWAKHNTRRDSAPYILVNKNHWYIADSPFSFATEKDRYLIFTDLLFDLLEEEPKYGPVRPAFVRFEDIHPQLPIWQLDIYSKVFERASIPFGISVIPVFADPFMVRVDDPTERVVVLNQKPHFIDFLARAKGRGASIIFHGVSHQYKDVKNPFNGLSGDDFEFWDGVNNRPIPEDSSEYVLNRLTLGMGLIKDAGFSPQAWLTPHYQASPLDFILFGQLFRWNIGRVTYFPFQADQVLELRDELRLENDTNNPAHNKLRRAHFDKLRVKYPEKLLPSGQFFPFEIWGDVYGQRLIPENLGNVQPFFNEQVHMTQDPEEIVESARRNRVLRDHWASLFVHPVLIMSQEEEGIGSFNGDGKAVLDLIKKVEALGYQFISLEEWVQENNGEKRPSPIEVLL